MFSTTDVQVDWHPKFFQLWIDKFVSVLRIDETQKVPTGTCPLRHRVGFAFVAFAVDHWVQPIVVRFLQRRFGTDASLTACSGEPSDLLSLIHI